MKMYHIFSNADNKKFLETCKRLESHYDNLERENLFLQEDGSLEQNYSLDGVQIRVISDYRMNRVYVESKRNLSWIVEHDAIELSIKEPREVKIPVKKVVQNEVEEKVPYSSKQRNLIRQRAESIAFPEKLAEAEIPISCIPEFTGGDFGALRYAGVTDFAELKEFLRDKDLLDLRNVGMVKATHILDIIEMYGLDESLQLTDPFDLYANMLADLENSSRYALGFQLFCESAKGCSMEELAVREGLSAGVVYGRIDSFYRKISGVALHLSEHLEKDTYTFPLESLKNIYQNPDYGWILIGCFKMWSDYRFDEERQEFQTIHWRR